MKTKKEYEKMLWNIPPKDRRYYEFQSSDAGPLRICKKGIHLVPKGELRCITCLKAYRRAKNATPEAKEKAKRKYAEKKANTTPEDMLVAKEAAREYRNRPETREKDKGRTKRYRNTAKFRKTNREYQRRKREEDPFFKFKQNLRILISCTLSNRGYTKKSRTYQIIGCSFEDCLKHLIETAIKNYGEYDNNVQYHVDHIIPLSTATTEEELLKLHHYTNLQYLKPEDNLKKSDSIDWKKI